MVIFRFPNTQRLKNYAHIDVYHSVKWRNDYQSTIELDSKLKILCLFPVIVAQPKQIPLNRAHRVQVRAIEEMRRL